MAVRDKNILVYLPVKTTELNLSITFHFLHVLQPSETPDIFQCRISSLGCCFDSSPQSLNFNFLFFLVMMFI